MSKVLENAAIALMPAATEFAAGYQDGRPQVVWTRLVADLETPVSAYMKLVRDRAPSFLLESIEGGESRGRYSIIGLRPDILWRAELSLIHISEPTRHICLSRMPSSA